MANKMIINCSRRYLEKFGNAKNRFLNGERILPLLAVAVQMEVEFTDSEPPSKVASFY